MNAFLTLFRTEAKLAIRDGNMLIFAVAFPVGIMLLLGFIASPEALRLDFAGIMCVGVCASGLMGLPLTFSSYRHEKILKRYQVTPVSPLTLLLADTLVQTVFAWLSALIIVLIARFGFGVDVGASPLRLATTLLFVQTCVFGIGFLIASLSPDVKTANWACTIVYFPMLFLSGATVPYEIMPAGLRAFSDVFPLTQGIKLMKGAVLGLPLTDDLARIAVLSGIALVSFFVSLAFFKWE